MVAPVAAAAWRVVRGLLPIEAERREMVDARDALDRRHGAERRLALLALPPAAAGLRRAGGADVTPIAAAAIPAVIRAALGLMKAGRAADARRLLRAVFDREGQGR